MTDSTPASALNANHFHARGGRVWDDGLKDPDLRRVAARALRCRSCGCLTTDDPTACPGAPLTANPTARCGCHGRQLSDWLTAAERSRVAAVVAHRYRIDRGAVFAMLSDGWTITAPLTPVDVNPNAG